MTAMLSGLLSGLRHGFVMDELDAWSNDSLHQLIPAQRLTPERRVDLDELDRVSYRHHG